MDRHLTKAAARQTDQQLIENAKAGDKAAFDELYARHRRLATSIATKICGAASAEDAVQVAFFSIWRNLGSYRRSEGSAKNWMMSAVRNRSIDMVRAQVRRPTYQPEIGFEPEDPARTEALVEEMETTRDLLGNVSRLPEDQGRVILLAYFRGFTQTEIASRLRIPLGTVKGRARLGLEKLSDELTESKQGVLAAA